MGRIVTPIDWGIVGRMFQVVVQAHPDEPELELRVVTMGDFVAHGIAARGICRLACAPSADAALRHCTVPACPEDGQYVLLLSQANRLDAHVSFSGVLVSEKHGWTSRHPRNMGELRRRSRLPYKAAAPLFSVITTVYDIEPHLLREIVASVLAQDFADFEWLVLDNGSRLRETVHVAASLGARDPRIRGFRVNENLHIVGGNRYLLEHARGRYIVPIDADDVLYPQALRRLAEAITTASGVAIAYGDEEKIDALGEPIEPMGREAWSRISAMGTVPCSHPMAFRRDFALELGVYTDRDTRGSHDWDTALRFADGGHTAVHVPSILYGWRVHAASTSLSASAKSYIGTSQYHVVHASLVRQGLDHLYEIRETEAGAGYFHLSRRHVQPSPVRLVLLLRGCDADEAGNALATLRATNYPVSEVLIATVRTRLTPLAGGIFTELMACKGWPAPKFLELGPCGSLMTLVKSPGYDGASGHVAIVDGALRVATPGWIWDALGALQLDARVGAVGGQIFDAAGNVLHLGLVTGMDAGVSTPHYGMPRSKVHLKNLLVRHRAVSGVHNGFAVVRDALVRKIGLPAQTDGDVLASSPEWTSAAIESGSIFAIAPQMVAIRDSSFQVNKSSRERKIDSYYARYFSRDSDEYGLAAPRKGRDFLSDLLGAALQRGKLPRLLHGRAKAFLQRDRGAPAQ